MKIYGINRISRNKEFKMRSSFNRHISIIRLAALALGALCFVQPQVQAQEEVSFVYHTISWGMVRGQTARITVFNPNEPVKTELTRQITIIVEVKLLDALGAVIAQSDKIAIPPSAFRSIDFKRGDLPIASERAQTRAQIRYRCFSIVDRTQLMVFPTSIELIDDVASHTMPLVSSKPKEIVVVGSKSTAITPAWALTELPVVVDAGRSLIGLLYGQTLRINALYPGDPADPQRQSVGARVRLYDASGVLLAQSAEVIIAPSEFHSFDFDRADIAASGEPAGGRLQLLMILEASATDTSSFTLDPKAAGRLVTSLELINNSTGRTAAVWLTVGFFEATPEPKPQ
jgi:hypothetical protein